MNTVNSVAPEMHDETTKEKNNRLFSIYQLILSFFESEEFELPAGQYLVVNEACIEKTITYVLRVAAEWDEDLFEHELVTRSEVLEALLRGPTLMQEHCEQLATVATAAHDKWQREFPECETFGEVVASLRMAGRA